MCLLCIVFSVLESSSEVDGMITVYRGRFNKGSRVLQGFYKASCRWLRTLRLYFYAKDLSGVN